MGAAADVWDGVRSIIEAAGSTVNLHTADHQGHACQIVKEADISNCDGIIGVGGDGTFHEIVNGLMQRQDGAKVPLGLIGAGTGNSFLHDLDCLRPDDAARRIIRGQKRGMDILRVETKDETIYAFNAVGWGLFSVANARAEKLRWLGGRRYTVAALLEIIKKRKYSAQLIADGKECQGDFVTIFACNTIHTGKGMKAAPRAKIDDGLVDLVCVWDDGRGALLKGFKGLYSGKYVNSPLVTYEQVRSFELQSSKEQMLTIDGELKGYSPFTAVVLPKAIDILL
jgi:sphingosine kinase